MHHTLYVQCREMAGREASPTACVIDSQSVKSVEKGGLHDPSGMTRGEDQGQEATYPGRTLGLLLRAVVHRRLQERRRCRCCHSVRTYRFWQAVRDTGYQGRSSPPLWPILPLSIE